MTTPDIILLFLISETAKTSMFEHFHKQGNRTQRRTQEPQKATCSNSHQKAEIQRPLKIVQ